MTASEFIAARTRLGESVSTTAFTLGLTPHVVEAFEAGSLAVPDRIAQQMTYRVAWAERLLALETSGLPECDWMQKHTGRARIRDILAHTRACATCEARDRYIADRFPPMPSMPLTGRMRLLGAISAGIQRLPPWLRPAAWGAVGIGAITLVRVALVVLSGGLTWGVVQLALLAPLVGAYLGAIGGLTYSLVHRPLQRLGRAGGYLTGLACAYAYMLAFVIPSGFLLHDRDFRPDDPMTWIIFGGVSTVLGLAFGYGLARRNRP